MMTLLVSQIVIVLLELKATIILYSCIYLLLRSLCFESKWSDIVYLCCSIMGLVSDKSKGEDRRVTLNCNWSNPI